MQQQQQWVLIDHELIISIVPIGQHIICIHRTHGQATATVTASTEREEEGVVVLLSFVYGSHRTIHYSSHLTYNTDSDIVT